eukprot:34947-Pyramimonas_sp.AAC.1
MELPPEGRVRGVCGSGRMGRLQGGRGASEAGVEPGLPLPVLGPELVDRGAQMARRADAEYRRARGERGGARAAG